MPIVAVAVILMGILGLQAHQSGEYSITPAHATPVAPLVKISGVATNARPGKFLLVDVYLQPLSSWELFLTHFQSHVQVVPADELTEPGVSTSELNAQSFLEMSDAKQAAEVAAFRAVGWHVPARLIGAVITGVVSPSPASRAGLSVGDLITGVGSTSVDSDCQLISTLHDVTAGTLETLHLDKVKISSSGTLSYDAPSTLRVATARVPGDVRTSVCPGASGVGRSFLGIELESGYDYHLPARVSIDTANIGGPSAGLAMTLALMNKLSHGSLTGDQLVAATGTMAPNGQVGAVGGVEEKAVAAHDSGAKYFIVPDGDGNVGAARAADQPDLKILPVTSLKEALRDLRKLGGARPSPLTRPS
ncbi:MAG: S16 family serine protease [Acidimicrobiales bacterium]